MSELTDKMRTCAAFIMGAPDDERLVVTGALLRDAADLLNKAADLLEAPPPPLGEPMEIFAPIADPFTAAVNRKIRETGAIWTDNQLPQSTPRRPSVCPKCDSHAGKTVVKVSRVVMLQCPVCDHTWKY